MRLPQLASKRLTRGNWVFCVTPFRMMHRINIISWGSVDTVKIHREGRGTLLVVGIGMMVLTALAYGLSQQPWVLGVMVGLSLGIWGFFAWFFRNPPRTMPTQAGYVFSPADGTVVDIQPIYEGEYFKAERVKISIYMSPLNVHLNRVPFDGVVRYVQYHAGKYLMAFHPKSSELNERNTVVLADSDGREVLVRQIAGFLARRIVSYLQPEQPVTAGQALGFIKFGSRCDVFIPLDATVLVTLQQKVLGGQTPLATL